MYEVLDQQKSSYLTAFKDIYADVEAGRLFSCCSESAILACCYSAVHTVRQDNRRLDETKRDVTHGWPTTCESRLRNIAQVVERRSLTGELSLSHARPIAVV